MNASKDRLTGYEQVLQKVGFVLLGHFEQNETLSAGADLSYHFPGKFCESRFINACNSSRIISETFWIVLVVFSCSGLT